MDHSEVSVNKNNDLLSRELSQDICKVNNTFMERFSFISSVVQRLVSRSIQESEHIIQSATILMQTYIRRWKAWKILLVLEFQKLNKEANTIAANWTPIAANWTTIAACWQGSQSRRELNCLREEARRKRHIIQSATILMQTYIRRWKAWKNLLVLEFQKLNKEANTIAVNWTTIAANWTPIAACWHGSQSRRELNCLREEARRKRAVAVIWAYWLGFKVRREYKKLSNAGRKIYKFTVQQITQKYFLGLRNTMPSVSPTDNKWPARPYAFLDSTHEKIKRIFHLWRCKNYRKGFKEEDILIYIDKLEASILFKGKKSLYPASIGQPFQGNYLDTKHPKYKILRDNIEEDIIFAQTVTKIHRTNGKSDPRIILITKLHFIIANNKSGKIKAKIPLGDITGLSITSKSDNFFTVHLKNDSEAAHKGDFLFSSTHVIEIATKLNRTVRLQRQDKMNFQINMINI